MKNKFRFHLCLICMFVFAVAGCKVKRPSDVISESKMENLLYDYHVAKSMGDNLPYSENYKKALYIDAVFKKYGTTQAAFDSSMVWYTRNTEILSKIYDKVKKRLKDEQELVGDLIAKRDKKPKMTKQGDSIDVWPWQRMVRLTGEMMDNQYVFTLPTDSNYKDRDTLVWEVRYRFLEPMLADSLRGVTMAMPCRFIATSPVTVIWLSALPCCWASISISISIPLISPLPLRNFGGGGIFRFPAGCAITFIFLWEATGRGKSANMPISSLPCSWAACGMALRGILYFGE